MHNLKRLGVSFMFTCTSDVAMSYEEHPLGLSCFKNQLDHVKWKSLNTQENYVRKLYF